MKIALLLLIAAFALAILGAVILRRDLSPKTDPMSNYLSGPYGAVVDFGYMALSGAIATLPYYLGRYGWFAAICYLSAFAVVAVVVTHRLRQSAPAPLQPKYLRAHIAAAGIAFIGSTILLMIHGWHHQVEFMFAMLAPLSAAAFYWFSPAEHSLNEWTYGACITAGFIALVLSP